jgi:hypothetical protein
MPATPLELIIALLLAVWFLASVLNQFGFRWFEAVRAYDYLGLLAEWKFFDRESGQTDYRLLYRERDTDGRLSGWREIPITERRRAFHCLWNPQKRSVKVLTDVASALLGSDLRHQRSVLLSLPYLLLLQTVSSYEIGETPVQRQFMIAKALGRRSPVPPQVLFRSEFHAIR